MRRIAFLTLVCSLLTGLAAGQELFGTGGSNYIGGPISGLFSSDRISMSQSFTASYLSTGKRGVFTNLYRNTIDYKISDQLQLQLGIGYRFTPGNSKLMSQAGRFDMRNNRGMLLPSFSMRYQPTESVIFQFQYQTVDPYQPFWREW